MPVAHPDPSKYSQIREEIKLDSRLSFDAVQQKRSRKPILSSLPWVLVVFLSFLSLFLYRTANSRRSSGWDTDFGKMHWFHNVDYCILWQLLVNCIGPAKLALRMKQVRFTGSPAFTDNGSFYVPNSGPVQYVGAPTPEIDEAWHQLTKGKWRLNQT